jgi:hypothetical protein
MDFSDWLLLEKAARWDARHPGAEAFGASNPYRQTAPIYPPPRDPSTVRLAP